MMPVVVNGAAEGNHIGANFYQQHGRADQIDTGQVVGKPRL
jgi:hypothetical protein